MIKETFIVEGKNDCNKIIETFGPDVKVIITNGSEVSHDTIKLINIAANTNGIILFLDPDGPGDIIRKRIEREVTGTIKHAFLPKSKCHSSNGRKIGIEHANTVDVKEAVESVYTVIDDLKTSNIFTMSDMVSLGLTGYKNSSNKRNYISNELNIGITNTKTFLKRVNQFKISIDEIMEILKEYEDEE